MMQQQDQNMSAVCRVCLAGNTRMYYIENIPRLCDVYAKLASTEFNADGMPRTICYICYSQLLRCHSFFNMAHWSDGILTVLLQKGIEITYDNILMLKVGEGNLRNLSITSTIMTSEDNLTCDNLVHKIKIEKQSSENIDVEISQFNEDIEMDDNLQDTVVTESLKTRDHYEASYKNCDICSHKFMNEIELSAHLQTHKKPPKINKKYQNNKIFQCDICQRIFARRDGIVKHMTLIHSEKKPYACRECDKRYAIRNLLTRHMKIHSGQKPYACNECDKTFHYREALVLHHRVHFGKKTHSCTDCDKKFITKQGLQRHKRVHSHTKEKPFGCVECGKMFSLKGHMMRHIIVIHTGAKPHECTECNMKFSYKANMIRHYQRIHSGEKMYSCTECNKSFFLKQELEIHNSVHTNEKPFACNECDKKYPVKVLLKKHMIIHSGETHICMECNKVFTYKSSLKQHSLRAHGGIKTHLCTECEKSFFTKLDLEIHTKVHMKRKFTQLASEKKPAKCESDSRTKGSLPLFIKTSKKSCLLYGSRP